MAEGKEIVIRIIGETEEEDKKVDSTGEDNKKVKAADRAIETLTKRAFNAVKEIGISEVKYQLNKYFMLQDDYMGQQKMEIALNVADKVYSTAMSVYEGIKLGSKAGPAGAVAGAALALGVSITTTSLQIAHNYEQERIKLSQMNAQLQFNRQRAGYSLTVGAQGENR